LANQKLWGNLKFTRKPILTLNYRTSLVTKPQTSPTEKLQAQRLKLKYLSDFRKGLRRPSVQGAATKEQKGATL
jgi:hypothetical protein